MTEEENIIVTTITNDKNNKGFETQPLIFALRDMNVLLYESKSFTLYL